MAVIRSVGALIGLIFGGLLGGSLLEISQVTPVDNRLRVVVLLGIACAIIGWLGAPYATVYPARSIVSRIKRSSAGDLVGGAIGLGFGLVLALLLSFPLAFLPSEVGRFAPLLGAIALGLLGATVGTMKRTELVTFVRELRYGGRRERESGARVLLDTSVIIDGRIADIVKAGFIRGTLIVPRFILAELQYFSDAPDANRRERGRRGLEMLSRMQKEEGVKVELSDLDPSNATGADAKLVAAALKLGTPIVTNDYGLNRVAELQGILVLNVNDLAKAVRPVVLPGEEIAVRIIQEGKEPGQGVGYLEDGTMIVVENGSRYLGNEMSVQVMRVLQTVGGRMIFAQPRDTIEARRPRAVNNTA